MDPKDLPQSVEGYREMIRKYLTPYNGKLTREFEKLYKALHIAGYYRGLLEDVDMVKDAFKAAKGFIKKISFWLFDTVKALLKQKFIHLTSKS